MGTLVTYNADNGTDGASCTTANLPASNVTVGGSGSLTFSASAAMTSGTLGYRFLVESAQRSYFQVNVANSKTYAIRGTLRMVSLPSSDRMILRTHQGAGTSFYLYIANSGRLRLKDANGGPFADGPNLTVGTDYDVSWLWTVGASTSDGTSSLKVYNKGSNTQVGVTASATALNLGTGLVTSFSVGTNDTAAGNCEYYWDTLRWEDGRTTDFPPHTALTYFDAENGVDGASCAPADFPATFVSTPGSGGSSLTYTASGAGYGRLGYRYNVVGAAAGAVAAIDVAASAKQYAFRGNLRLLSAPTGGIRIAQLGSPTDGLFAGLVCNTGPNLQIVDTNSSGVGGNISIAVGTEYSVSVATTMGASTNDGQWMLKVYQKTTGAQVGSTSSGSTANFTASGTAAPVSRFHLGNQSTTNSNIEYVWDSVRFADQADELAGPTAASASLPASARFTAGAVLVPKVGNPLLRLG